MVEGQTCETMEGQGLLKKLPQLTDTLGFDSGSMTDSSRRSQIRWFRMCASGRRRRSSPETVACGGGLADTALDHVVWRQNMQGCVRHIAEVLANTTVQKGRWFWRPRRPAPEGGGADLTGVQAPVLRCVCRTKDGGMRLLTTRRWSKSVHGRGRSDEDEDQ
jgi:hypothetical protein